MVIAALNLPDSYICVLDDDKGFASCDRYLDVFVFRNTENARCEIAGTDVALQAMIEELDGVRPKNPKKAFDKVTKDNRLIYNMFGIAKGPKTLSLRKSASSECNIIIREFLPR